MRVSYETSAGTLPEGPFQDPGQCFFQVREFTGPDDEPLKVSLGRLGVEIHLREDDGHADRRRTAPCPPSFLTRPPLTSRARMPRAGFATTKSDSENCAPLVRIFS